ncbi:MAG: VanZ family protein [Eubacterium sp.]|nr:VanZ family protein [Eubacterium sp.]
MNKPNLSTDTQAKVARNGKQKHRTAFTILLFLTITWMLVIFTFSAQPAEESTDTSMFWGRMAGELLVPGFKNWPEEKKESFAEKMDYPMRKAAHATEYAILGILLFATLYPLNHRDAELNNVKKGIIKRSRTGASFTLGALYAASDEIHQLFVPGRSGQFTDVLIDSGGVLAGILLALLFLRFAGRMNKVRKRTSTPPALQS